MAAVQPALAQVYKWVDERGVTHYGERPPQGVKASEVPDKLASPPPPGAESAPKDQGPGKSEGGPAAQDPRGTPSRPQTREQVEAERRQQQCEQQRAILERLKQGTLNEKGERVPTDNSEVIAQQEKRVIAQCRG